MTWSSGTPATATVTTNGIVVGQAAGTSTITATVNSVPGTTILTVVPAVARFAYVSGSGDSNTAIYVVKPATASLLPTGSGFIPNFPTQAIPEPSGRFIYFLAGNSISAYTIDPVTGRGAGLVQQLVTGLVENQGVVDPTG